MFAALVPHLASAARWGWRNRRELAWLHSKFTGNRGRGRGRSRVSYMRGWSQGMRQAQNRRNFGYGRGGMSRRRRR